RKDRLGWWRSVGWAEAAATRCQDGELIAGAHLEARGGAERLHRTVGAPDERLAALARLSPGEPEGGDAAVIREQRSRQSRPELERLEAALVQRNRPLDERAEHIQHRRRAHRARRVEVVCALGRGAGEVDARAAPLAIDVDAHRDELTVIHRVAKAPGLQSSDG